MTPEFLAGAFFAGSLFAELAKVLVNWATRKVGGEKAERRAHDPEAAVLTNQVTRIEERVKGLEQARDRQEQRLDEKFGEVFRELRQLLVELRNVSERLGRIEGPR